MTLLPKSFSRIRTICLIPFFAWILGLIVIPNLQMLYMSLTKGKLSPGGGIFDNYSHFIQSDYLPGVLGQTTFLSIITTLLNLIIAYPIAYYLAKMLKGSSRAVVVLIIVSPFWISEVVRTYSWMLLLRESGVISWLLQTTGIIDKPLEMLYNDGAVFAGLVYNHLLFMLVSLYGVLETLDDSQVEASRDLGAGVFTTFREIVWPHSLPGVMAGCIIVFMLTMGTFLTPVLLGGEKTGMWFTESIYRQFSVVFNWHKGSAHGFILLATSTFIVWLALTITRQKLAEVVRE